MPGRCAIGISMLAMLVWGMPRAEAAGKEQRRIKWEGLSALIGKKVRIVMPDGARIEGKATALELDAFAVEIRKTSNPAAYPRGKFLVPRATLKAVDVNHPTKQWRILCTAAGGALGLFFGVEAAIRVGGILGGRHNASANAAFVSLAIGTPIAGYLIGSAADRRTITYVIAE
jgi:hypothetical protein